jgi:CRP-like cAMP-binding protein
MKTLFERYGKNITYKKGSALIKQHFPLTHLYIIKSGRAKALRFNVDGKELLLEIFNKNAILGDIELTLDKTTAGTTIIAITDVEAIQLSMSFCHKMMKENIEFSNLVAKNLANKLNNTSLQFSINNSLGVKERLLQYIETTCTDGVFDENLVELSGLLSVSYRHLNRTINSLVEDGKLIIIPTKSKIKKIYRLDINN